MTVSRTKLAGLPPRSAWRKRSIGGSSLGAVRPWITFRSWPEAGMINPAATMRQRKRVLKAPPVMKGCESCYPGQDLARPCGKKKCKQGDEKVIGPESCRLFGHPFTFGRAREWAGSSH